MNNLNYKLTCKIYKDDKCFGPGIAQLLTLVKETHSLRQSAIAMNMAYSKAWTIIKQSENCLGFKLLETTTGGKGGGSATLTIEAQEMLDKYSEFIERMKTYGDSLFNELFNSKQ